MRIDPIEINGLTLINKVIEFVSSNTDTDTWTLDKQKNYEPDFVRLQQLQVLLKVFTPEIFKEDDLQLSLQSFLKGDFIKLRDITAYEFLFKNMDEVIIAKNKNLPKSRAWTLHDLRRNYVQIIKYKINLYKLLNFNDGILEISYPGYYALEITSSTSEKIDTTQIDDFLCHSVDPLNRTFLKANLIRDFNYPADDVYDLDLENF